MFKRLQFLLLYGLCWILLFQFYRVVFLAYHFTKTLELSESVWTKIAWFGLRMDISFAGYTLMIPTILVAFTFKRWQWYYRTIKVYTSIVALIIVFLVVADLELFRAWGFRIDTSSLHYLQTPLEAWASMSAAPIFSLCCILLALFLLSYKLLSTIASRSILSFSKSSPIVTIPSLIIMAALLIIPIRGGLQLAPMNESAVYFSNQSFANYAAVNVPWNYSRSALGAGYSKENPFKYFEDKEAKAEVAKLYVSGGQGTEFLKHDQPINVLVIIWESFTAKAVSAVGGLPGITPQFNSLTREGILFTNLYASGNRSDKGMVAILSGYPAQPTTSIIKIPTKTASLPSVPKTFHRKGYFTSFYYGGETEFANMKSYFLQQEFDKIIDKKEFASKDMNSKWGAHDHIVFNRLLSDLDNQKRPFFTTLFTLSSHEPFEVPVKTAIAGNDNEHLFLNSLHYTDASLGAFIRSAKTKSWWNNTLVVIIADHGHPMPDLKLGQPGDFHIPMLWLGGALKAKNVRIDTLCSQTDLASTLLNQLKLPSAPFSWSNDIFRPDRKPFAYFAFTNGFGWMKPEGYLVRENIAGHITEQKGKIRVSEAEIGKAYLQASFDDYLKR